MGGLGAIWLLGAPTFAGTYTTGVAHYEAGELADAHRDFSQIDEGDVRYMQARYLDGVIYARQGRLKSAVLCFREVIEAAEDMVLAAEEEALVDELVGNALLAIAGTYYSIQRFDEATTYTLLVQEHMPSWSRAQRMAAWATFLSNDLDASYAHLDALDDQATPERKRQRLAKKGRYDEISWPAWAPERHELRYLLAYNEGCYLRAEQALEPLATYQAVFDTPFDLDAPPSDLHGALAQEVLRDRELQALRRHGTPDQIAARTAEVLDDYQGELHELLEAAQVNLYEAVDARSFGDDACDPPTPAEQDELFLRAIGLSEDLLASEILPGDDQGTLMLRLAADLEHRNSEGDAERAQVLMEGFLAEHPDHWLRDDLSREETAPAGSP